MNQRRAQSADRQRLLSSVREDRLAELRHRLTNNLQLVLALIAKESANTQDPEVKAALRRLASRVQDLTATEETAEEVELSH